MPRTDSAATSAASTEALRLLDLALTSEKQGDLERADGLLHQAQTTWPSLAGIDYRLSLLALRRGEIAQARLLLDRSLARGQEVAAAHRLRSALFRAENHSDQGFEELAAATRADPFNPKSFYFWAEALRRAGKTGDAAGRLQEALVRTNDPLEEDFYAFKLRLVEIELNGDSAFVEEMAAKLRDPGSAPTEWLLTAAALEIKRENYAVAATYLVRAKARLSAGAAGFLLNDQTFADQAWRKEFAPIFAAPPKSAVAATSTPSPVPSGDSNGP